MSLLPLLKFFFGESAMTFNVRQLLHLSQCVLHWGPLLTYSCYGFEAANKLILQSIRSIRGAPHQVVRWINFNHSKLLIREHVFKNVSSVVKTYYENILVCRIAKDFKINRNTYFRKKLKKQLNPISICQKNHLNFGKLLKITACMHVFREIICDSITRSQCYQTENFSKSIILQLTLKKKIKIVFGYFIKSSNVFLTLDDFKIVKLINTNKDYLPTSRIAKVCVFVNIDHDPSAKSSSLQLKKTFQCVCMNVLYNCTQFRIIYTCVFFFFF